MKELPEWVGKQQFQNEGVRVPENKLIESGTDISAISFEVELPIVVKAQVPVSGRGKKGGIRFVDSPEEARQSIEDLLGSTIEGHTVERVLVEEAIPTDYEIYLAISANGDTSNPLLLFSESGGSDIESVADKFKAEIQIDPLIGLREYHARHITSQISKSELDDLSPDILYEHILEKMWEIFINNDLKLLEINPIGITNDGVLIALDSKCVVDGVSAFRQDHSAIHSSLTGLERFAEEQEVYLREGGGNIGIFTTGAGTGLALIDLVTGEGEEMGVFIDIHGTSFKEKKFKEYIKYFNKGNVDVVIVNISGSLIDCNDVANQILFSTDPQIPIVARFNGPNEEKAISRCKENNVPATDDLPEAASIAVDLQRER
ncbi:ATP-grasp domain-containing protein [Natronorubrum sp. FCH18a]|uniref:ATP-grasp domain-containing protein n=1 Tax=Natronorubrum sp. FCH18a TaxID=3447018 RepID=UPI003F510611